MTTLKKIWHWWLRPKRFEYFRGLTIYDFIGIRMYKKYLPTTGDIARRWRKIKQIDIGKPGRTDQLYAYELKTRNYEWRHLLGILILLVLAFTIDRRLTIFDYIFLTLLNLYVNIYPILLQRYNRIRIIQTLIKYGHPSPYA